MRTIGLSRSLAVAAAFWLQSSAIVQADTLSGTFSTATFTRQNFIAVWIENQAGQFIKTLRLWGNPNSQYMSQFTDWVTASNKNITDAVTGATLSGNQTGLTFAWDGQATNGTAVPNGTYSLKIGSVERNNMRETSTTSIVLNGTTRTVAGTATTKIINISVNIVGNSTESRSQLLQRRNNRLSIEGTNLLLPVASAEHATVSVYSLNGERLQKRSIATTSPSTTVRFSGIPAGVYVFSVSDGQSDYAVRGTLLSR